MGRKPVRAPRCAHTHIAPLRTRFGSPGCSKLLANILGFEASTMRNVRKGTKGVSASMALRTARFAVTCPSIRSRVLVRTADAPRSKGSFPPTSAFQDSISW